MNIWKLVTKNLIRHPHTHKPDQSVDFPDRFRGELIHHPELCTACGTCAYVCSPGAIQLNCEASDKVLWQYQMLQCAYCGRCVEYCPTQALSFEEHPAKSVYELALTEHEIKYQKCSRCGEPIIPLPHIVLESKYRELTPEIEKLNSMCERCRKKVHSIKIKHGFTGN